MAALTDAPRIIQRYFELASSPDGEDLFALFADGAIVEDEGNTHTGVDAIRAWRAAVPLVEYAITDVEAAGDGLIVTGTVTGDFPGSPLAGMRFHFEDFDEDHLKVLRIHA